MVKNMTLESDCLGSDSTSAAPWMCGLTRIGPGAVSGAEI